MRPAAPPGDPLPSFVVIGSREDNPTESSPLTYREYVYSVAEGTSEGDARRLILERFEHVRGTLDPQRAGKLINLAVFDHVFHGRPQRRPLVTLAWKDWKGEEPEIRFPQREAGAQARPSAPDRPSTARRIRPHRPARRSRSPWSKGPPSTPGPRSRRLPSSRRCTRRSRPLRGATPEPAKPVVLPSRRARLEVPRGRGSRAER